MTARTLTKALRGQWHGSYGMACCPAHDDRRPSLSIAERDGKVLAHCHAGCDQEAVWSALKDMGLMGGGDTQQRRLTLAQRPEPHRKSTGRMTAALRVWHASEPATNTLVQTYLRGRGITLPVPPSIRYHSHLKHGPTGLYLLAMVAAVQASNRRITAVHRTYLLPDGSGKARLLSPKLALGPIGDGAVRPAKAGPVLGIAEGIETALSAMQLFEIPCWAALGARMDKVSLPADVIEVQIFCDNGDEGHVAAEKAAEAFAHQGKRVCLRFPPEGLGDWNDYLRCGQ